MNETINTTMEEIEETKDALVEAAQETDSCVGKVLLGLAIAGVVIGGGIYGVKKHFDKKKAQAANTTAEDVTDDSEVVDEDSEE